MAWKELVTQAFNERATSSGPSFPRFEPGATEARLDQAARSLAVALPEALRAFLAECDGVMEVMEVDGRQIDMGWLMWTADAIVARHAEATRTALGPPATWLVFADAGADGILFAYDRAETDGHIWAWHPVEGRRQQVAESLRAFLRGWITGELTV
jgi:hypothetical protein